MIEVDIPSIDPIQHEPKLIFGLTMRQALCVIVGGGLGVGAYFLMNMLVGEQNLCIISALTFMLPAVALGWYRPYNMKCEEYLRLLYFNTFESYPQRILKTDGAQDVKMPTLKERQEMERKLQQKRRQDKKEQALKKQAATKKGGRV